MSDYDVIVVGGGGAGMAAAITAADAGAQVLVVEAASELGGSTALSTGVVYAAGTSVQREIGVDDDPDAMFQYYMTINQWKVEPAIVRQLCERAGPAIEWLKEIGVVFPPKRLYASGVDGVPRGHAPKGGGAAIARALAAQLDQRPVDVALGRRVTRLLVERGRVVGVEADGEAVMGGATVVTTGGFGHDRGLLEAHYPDALASPDWAWAISAPTCVGDGLRMAESVGASLAGHNRGLLMVTAAFEKTLEAGVPPWTIFVNGEGRRFVDESAPYAVMGGVIQRQPGRCWAVFDESTRSLSRHDMRWPTWEADQLARRIEAGSIERAPSIEELADVVQLPALEATIAAYNSDAASGRDAEFSKDPSLLHPLASTPVYATEIRVSVIALTSCGPRIDPTGRVVGRDGNPIGGLFAGGEVTGNVLGDRYIGGGNSIANALVFGRIAGASAAAEAVGSKAGRPGGELADGIQQ